jgi:hypothetical protein
MKRFELVHTYEIYSDYESTSDMDAIRRVTLVEGTGGKPNSAYLTMRDYSERTISREDALNMIEEDY